MITIIPAIDLKDGKCVRLKQGKATEVTVYSEDPVTMAQRWEAEGAQLLHIVDLDGAFQGKPVHTALLAKIAAAIAIPIEVGGGLRTETDISTLIDAGARRVILGTKACMTPDSLAPLIQQFGDKLAVGIDARNGLVQVKGWVETTAVKAVDLAVQLDALGIKTLIYTDTAVDGMLRGVNAGQVAAVCKAVSCDVIASGGIASAEDIRILRNLAAANLAGAIVGKALYENCVSLSELLAAATRP
ncbi:MAG: 1-(5-phosphoribosyl)-5-[(5-phosphoribosylamino)methylideneamino]imidazole-4-carboxamide isomerase [bacterium]